MNTEERDAIIEKLKEEYPIMEQVKFNEFNVAEKLQMNMELKIKYQELYEHNLFVLNKLKDKYEELKGKRYDFYRFESDRNLSKTEVEQYYMPQDRKLKEFKQLMEKQEVKVAFFKLCMSSIGELY